MYNLSLGLPTLKGLIPPLGLGILTILMGLNLNLPVPNSFDNLFKYIIFIPSNVSNVVPGVILPGLLLILLYANINISTFL